MAFKHLKLNSVLMKISSIAIIFFTFLSTGISQSENFIKQTVKVSGTCEMCKSTIEKAAKSINGVKFAKWNPSTKVLKVKFAEGSTDLDEIEQAIAAVGYDTEKFKATDEVYQSLHHCCQYERDQNIP